jgi:uncharacterized membrane protein YeaQ/YmgE (transglycosylase-associated protein family)
MSLIGQILFGLVIGVLAKLLMPGEIREVYHHDTSRHCGSLVGTFVGRACGAERIIPAGWITSILGAFCCCSSIVWSLGGALRPELFSSTPSYKSSWNSAQIGALSWHY